MKDIWKIFENKLKVNHQDFQKNLNPPATDEKIHHLQKNLNIQLPFEFIETLKIHDGQKGRSPPIFGKYQFLPISEILSEWRTMNDLLGDGDFDDAKAKSSPEVVETWWHKNWIPFAANGGGDLLCLDMSPSSQGTLGQVIEYIHDAPLRAKISRDFSGFLKDIIKFR